MTRRSPSELKSAGRTGRGWPRMDDEMNGSLGAQLEMERRLERYAEVRLGPSPVAVARMRARIMREARLGFAEAAARSSAKPAPVTGSSGQRLVLRRTGALVAAACLTLGLAAGTMAASQAGGPLYGPRVALEELTLPSDPEARAAAEVVRLDSRLAEFVAAAKSRDAAGIAAALDAYQAIAEAAVAAAGTNPAALETLKVALGKHVMVLEAVAAQVPEQARGPIEQSIERADNRTHGLLDRLEATTPGPASERPVAAPAAERTPKPDTTQAPTASAKPNKPVRPPPAPVLSATEPPAPAATPDIQTPKPGGQPSERPGRTPPNDFGSNAVP